MLYPSGRYTKKKKGLRSKRQFKKVSFDYLYIAIKKELLGYKAKSYNYPIRAEWFANDHLVPIHLVTQVFKKLNTEGILSQKHNIKNDLRWNASYYYLR